ncbi:MAG: SAM-dependent methyltransferase [Verrucomicrobia bacterium]|nr:SAM-dependent methyltransferase [Verrucomicrobiota bacterium]MBU6445861.1 SAM-dependent methyltransferase [Verrucomicrobiota bacterium]
MHGKLLLLPNLLDESLPAEPFLPISVNDAVRRLQGLIAESEKMARRYLRRFLSHDEMAKLPLALLNEHSKELTPLIQPLKRGETWGLISDAGLPCLADPGSDLVWLAHQNGIAIETFVGPSSIIMALQYSGFSGQQFAFHGYLPRETADLEKRVRELEKIGGTHIWIEAPYRSAKMLDLLKQVCKPTTRLCVAANLTTPYQRVVSQTVARWKEHSFVLEKEPVVFLIA